MRIHNENEIGFAASKRANGSRRLACRARAIMAYARRAALILLADDDGDARQMYAEYLLLSGFAVVQARNGHDALDVARSCRPDVVVTDVEMPRMGGL